MNPNYALKLKEKIDKRLRVGFIRSLKHATWLSPIMVVSRKIWTIRVCIDYRKLNATEVADAIAGHKVYNFLDGFHIRSRCI